MIYRKSINKFKRVLFFPLILAHLTLLISTKFTLWPEMMVYPYLLNNNFLLYKDIINPYPPTLIYVLSVLTRFFTYSISFYQITTWLLVIVVDLTIYYMSLKINKNITKAVVSLSFFALFSIPFGVNGLWFDLIQTPIILISFYNFLLFSQHQHKKHLQRSFLLIFIAAFIKQQAIWVVFLYLAILSIKYKSKITRIVVDLKTPTLLLASFTVFLAIFFYFKGTLNDVLFWAFYVPFFKASSLPGYISIPTLKQFSLATIVLLPFVLSVRSKDQINHLIIFSSIILLTFAYPRFDYFHLIPFLSLLSLATPGVFFPNIRQSASAKLICICSLIFLSYFTLKYLSNNWGASVRFFDGDTLSSATFLSIVTSKDDRIYIQNGPDQLFPLANRLPPKPWADEFPWYLEISNLQERVVTGIREGNVKYVLYKPYENGNKFDLGAYRPTLLGNYLEGNFHEFYKINNTLWLKIKN